MKKLIVLTILSLLLTKNSWAKHEKGGYITYQYIGPATDTTQSIYKITVTVFFSCSVSGPKDLTLSIYDAKQLSSTYTYLFTGQDHENETIKTTYSPCVDNPPSVDENGICYRIDTYTKQVTLPNNPNGYIIGVITAGIGPPGHRVNGIVNIYDQGGCPCTGDKEELQCYSSCGTELALWAKIPGVIGGLDYHKNSTPTFQFKDTVLICYGQKFEYQFDAIDTLDHDSISYSFGPAQDGAIITSPPYPSVIYASGYSGTSPLGSKVTINPSTGLISGIAPTTTGQYIVDVFAIEWRNGVVLDSLKKELQVNVNNCNLLSANLNQVYRNCDSLILSFQNQSTASNINQYIWTFGDTASGLADTSTSPTVTHKYTKPGDYTLSLYVSDTVNGCNNTATAQVKVYPGFKPKFTYTGSCYLTPFNFMDVSTTNSLDSITSWNWNFGDPTFSNNTATTSTTSHTYSKPDTLSAILQVTSYQGCSGSDTLPVYVTDKPYIFQPFTDTLICDIDTLPLLVKTSAPKFNWTRTADMIYPDSINPLVHPSDTTIYTFTAYQNGCQASVYDTVNVLKFISVKFDPDTMHACKTDNVLLNPVTQALSFLWRESDGLNTLNSYSIKNPTALPINNATTYYVAANLGHCADSSKVTVYVSPYPKVAIVQPATDTATICYGDSIKLNATKTGAYIAWSPINGLSNSNTTSLYAKPDSTTTYVVSVRDTFYCAKSVTDTVTINVVPPFSVNAGDDTSVVVTEKLPLYAHIAETSFPFSVSYQWSPATYLDNIYAQNPLLTPDIIYKDNITYTVTATTTDAAHCKGTGSLKVTFYTTKPNIFVPTVFTPNGTDYRTLLPICVGISQFNYFRVFNRDGQQVYSTNQIGKGWNGQYNGMLADVGTYVFEVSGIDYNGNPIYHKGTLVLLR